MDKAADRKGDTCSGSMLMQVTTGESIFALKPEKFRVGGKEGMGSVSAEACWGGLSFSSLR